MYSTSLHGKSRAFECKNCGSDMKYICMYNDFYSPVNWCPSCGTMAVDDGDGWGPSSYFTWLTPDCSKKIKKTV